MPKIDIAKLQVYDGTDYPAPFRKVVAGRARKRLGLAAGLDQFGVNLTTLKPGAASALRHWHEKEDEFVYILQGEVVLIEDGGETVLKPGDAAGFKANNRNGHHRPTRAPRTRTVYLEMPGRAQSTEGAPNIPMFGMSIWWRSPGRKRRTLYAQERGTVFVTRCPWDRRNERPRMTIQGAEYDLAEFHPRH